MVAHDSEFKVDLTKFTDDQLLERRYKFFSGLYDGEEGSRDNVEKRALIEAVDRELDRRNKKGDKNRSNIAIMISVLALLLSAREFLLFLWQQILSLLSK